MEKSGYYEMLTSALEALLACIFSPWICFVLEEQKILQQEEITSHSLIQQNGMNS